MQEPGWLSVNRVSAASGSREQGNGKKRKRIEKVSWVETKTVITPAGEIGARLIAQGGRIGLGETTRNSRPGREIPFTRLVLLWQLSARNEFGELGTPRFAPTVHEHS